jgi:DNA-binding response OmpR family regulator
MFNFLKRKPRVLVLDDDVSMQKLVAALLRRAGFHPDVVNSGRAAIGALEKKTYAVALLDLMMPHEGGMTVLQHLRKKQPQMLQHTILMTATPQAVLHNVARDIFAVVQKPFDGEELIATVRRAV